MADDFTVGTRLPELTQQLALGSPMSPIYIAPEDALQVTLLNSHPTAVFCFSGRLLLPSGKTVPLVQELLKSTNGTDVATVIPLAEGYLLSACLLPLTSAPVRGECFGIMMLIRGMIAGVPYYAMLGSGYVSVLQPLAWPWAARTESTFTEPGMVDTTNAGPVTGAAYVSTVPARRAWLIKTINFTLVTNATAGDRTVQIAFFNLSVPAYVVRAGAVQAASTTVSYSAGVGIAATGVGATTQQNITLPEGMMLLPGWAVQVTAIGLQVGDTFSSIAIGRESFAFFG